MEVEIGWRQTGKNLIPWAEDVTQWSEHLPGMSKNIGSILSITKNCLNNVIHLATE